MWIEMVAADLERLWRVGLKRVRPGDIVLSSGRYLFETEVHAYAFSIAANALLSFFPFNLILLAICRRWLHWESAYQTILQLLSVNLPNGGDFVIRNLVALVHGRPRLQMVSVLMLFFTSSGVFLPLEIALNKVWGFPRNRTFLKNQGMSFVLALVSGVLALCFILAITPLRAAITFLIGWIPSPQFPHDGVAPCPGDCLRAPRGFALFHDLLFSAQRESPHGAGSPRRHRRGNPNGGGEGARIS